VNSPNIEKLGNPERYFLEVMSIPRLDARLEAFYICQTFASKLTAIKESVTIISGAISEIKRSKKLLRLLEIVLCIGNYLNGSTFRGGAYGFKLDALLKLSEIKTSSNKETLVNFLAELAETQFLEVKDLGADFPHLESASKEPLQQVSADLAALKKGLSVVEKELGQIPPDSSDRLKSILSNFYDSAFSEFETVEAMLKETEKAYKEVAASFGEDETTDSQTFFSYLWKFVANFEKAKEDNTRRKVMAEKARAAVATAAAKKQLMLEKRAAKASSGGGGAAVKVSKPHTLEKEKGILENQLTRMRMGLINRKQEEAVHSEAISLFERMKNKRETVALTPAAAAAVVAPSITTTSADSSSASTSSVEMDRRVPPTKSLPQLPQPQPQASASPPSTAPIAAKSEAPSVSEASGLSNNSSESQESSAAN